MGPETHPQYPPGLKITIGPNAVVFTHSDRTAILNGAGQIQTLREVGGQGREETFDVPSGRWAQLKAIGILMAWWGAPAQDRGCRCH